MSGHSDSSDHWSKVAAGARQMLAGELGLLLGLAVIVLLFAAEDYRQHGADAAFLSVRNFRVVLAQTSTVAVAALGMTLIIISGGIDLSAGTALTLCATVMALCLKHEWAVELAVLATLGCGCLCGMLNGLLISTLQVVPFIVTLGTLTIYLGIGKTLASESTVFPARDNIPHWLQEFSSTKPPHEYIAYVPRIPAGVWWALVLAVAVGALLRYSVFGRHVFALGSNEATARLCGINIWRTRVAVYTLAGLLVGIAGVYKFSILRIGNPAEGQGIELEIIAAVVIGGGSLNGGRGSVIGTLTGAAIMSIIRSGCDQLEVANPYQDMIVGAIIIGAVTLDQMRARRRETG